MAAVALGAAAWATGAVAGVTADEGEAGIAAMEALAMGERLAAGSDLAEVEGTRAELTAHRVELMSLDLPGVAAAVDAVLAAASPDGEAALSSSLADLRAVVSAAVIEATSRLDATRSTTSWLLPVLPFLVLFAIPAVFLVSRTVVSRKRVEESRELLTALHEQRLPAALPQNTVRGRDFDAVDQALKAIDEHLQMLSLDNLRDREYLLAVLESTKRQHEIVVGRFADMRIDLAPVEAD
jgi:hypothetical protein